MYAICFNSKTCDKSSSEISKKIKTGSDIWKTNFEVTSTKTSFIIFLLLAKYPTAIIKKTGATMFVVNKILSNNAFPVNHLS